MNSEIYAEIRKSEFFFYALCKTRFQEAEIVMAEFILTRKNY